MKLNYRDRVILGVLIAIALLIAGFVLLVKPKNAEIKANKASLAELEQKRDEVDSLIAQIPGIKEDIKGYYNDAKKLTGDFVNVESILNARRVDQYMQKYAEENECKISMLTVSDLAEGGLTYYYFTPAFVGQSQLVQADINGTKQQEMAKELAESTALAARNNETVLQATYNVEVSGEKENFWDYMKALEEQDKTIIINSITFNNLELKEDEDKKKDDEDEELIPTAQINISLYSIYEMDEPNLEMTND